MKKTNKYETFCPLFPGFYGSEFEYENEESDIEYYNEENKTNLNWDDFDWDYKDYHLRASKAFVNRIERELNDYLPVKLEFEDISTPKEYNFYNDSINVKCEVSLTKLLKLIKAKKEQASQYFIDKYSPRSGFIPFHSSQIENWTNKAYILKEPEHRIGALLNCLCEIEGIKADWDWISSDHWIDFSPKNEVPA